MLRYTDNVTVRFSHNAYITHAWLSCGVRCLLRRARCDKLTYEYTTHLKIIIHSVIMKRHMIVI